MKRILSLLIVIMLCITTLVPVANATGTALTVGSASVEVNKSVTINIALRGNAESGFTSGMVELSYDQTALQLTALDKVAFNGYANPATGKANHSSLEGVKGDVTLVTATFTALKAGNYTVSATMIDMYDAEDNYMDVANGTGTITVTVPPCATHTWGEYTGSEPTCTADGVKSATCSVCGATDTKTTPATGHTAGDPVVTPATCTKTGSEVVNCTVCSEKISEKTLPVISHSYGEWTKSDENNHKQVCSVCGAENVQAHTWDKGVVTKEADCKNDGVKTYTCSACKTTKTEVIKATGNHVYANWKQDDEKTHTGTCGCGETKTEDHTWDKGFVTKEADCKNDGVKTYTCTICAATKTETIKATGEHNYTNWVEVDGKHQGTCTGCGDKSEILDHTWNSGVIDPKPTCVETGVKTYTCTACKATKTETVAATGKHDFASDKTSDYVINEDGTHTIKCSGCDETKTEKHEYTQEGSITVKPTTSSEGKQEWLCVCGDKTVKSLPKVSADLDDVAKTGDITGQIVLFTVTVLAVAAAAAYVFMRKTAK